MKKHNFLHRLTGWVEQELEATLAVLIVLAAVVGYSLAGTETATNSLTAQEAAAVTDGFVMGANHYSTLSFDSSLSGYLVRRIAASPSDVAVIKGKGLVGSTAGAAYTATFSLSEPFSGIVYLLGTYDSATLNGSTVTGADKPIAVTDASKFILNFMGGTNYLRGISINPGNKTEIVPEQIANVSILPATLSTIVGSPRNFILILTDNNGKALSASNYDVNWSVICNPSGIATISQGTLTTTGVGTVTVKAIVGGKPASATVTVIAKPTTVEATKPTSFPGATEEGIGNSTTQGNRVEFQFIPPSLNSADEQTATKSILDQFAELLVKPADAATNEVLTPTKAATQVLFSDAAALERGSTAPKNAELKAVTQNMPTLQKISTTISVSLAQIKADLTSMFVGTTLKDSTGKVVVNRPNAFGLVFRAVQNLLTGANAGTMGATPNEDMPLQ